MWSPKGSGGGGMLAVYVENLLLGKKVKNTFSFVCVMGICLGEDVDNWSRLSRNWKNSNQHEDNFRITDNSNVLYSVWFSSGELHIFIIYVIYYK